jgi:hypothetical protein
MVPISSGAGLINTDSFGVAPVSVIVNTPVTELPSTGA